MDTLARFFLAVMPEKGGVTLALLSLLDSWAPKAVHYIKSGPRLGDRI